MRRWLFGTCIFGAVVVALSVLGFLDRSHSHDVKRIPSEANSEGRPEPTDLQSPNPDRSIAPMLQVECAEWIRGVVEDAGGGTIAGARISARVPGSDYRLAVLTAADGQFSVCVPKGTVRIDVSAEGYAKTHELLSVFEPTTVNFKLTPASAIEGHVIDTAGKPLGGAEVILLSDVRDSQSIAGLTDDEGQFRFEGLYPGAYTVQCRTRDSRFGESTPLKATIEAGQSSSIDCRIRSSLVVDGHVQIGSTPIPQATVVASVGSETRGTVTARDGTFAMSFDRVGTLHFSVLGMTLNSPSNIAFTSNLHNVVLSVDGTSSIAGRVTVGGAPVEKAVVTVQSNSSPRWEAMTSSDGSYQVALLGAGSYRIRAVSERLDAASEDISVDVTAREVKTGVDLELDRSATIEGRVIDTNGAPVGGALVTFLSSTSADRGSALTSADGRFRVRFLAGRSEYKAVVSPYRESMGVFRAAKGHPFPIVSLRDDFRVVSGVEIVVDGALHRLTGRVVESDGAPSREITVTIAGHGDKQGSDLSITTDSDGIFSTEVLPAGQYDLVAESEQPRRRVFVEGVSPGGDPVTITMPRTSRIRGSLLGFPPNTTVAAAAGRVWFNVSVDGTHFTVEDVPEGDVEVAALGEGVLGVETVHVSPPADASVTISSRPTARTTVTVPDIASGRVVPDSKACVWAFGLHGTAAAGPMPLEVNPSGRAVIFPPVGAYVAARCARYGTKETRWWASGALDEVRGDGNNDIVLVAKPL